MSRAKGDSPLTCERSTRLCFVAVGAVVGARPHLGVQAAGVGPLVVHRAAAGLGIEKLAVATGAAGQAEDAVLEVEVLDQPGFAQAFGDLLGVFVLGLKRVNQLQPHQIGQLDLDRHGAAVGRTGVAQAVFVTGPGFAAVNVYDGNGGSHGADYPRMCAANLPNNRTFNRPAPHPNNEKSLGVGRRDKPIACWP